MKINVGTTNKGKIEAVRQAVGVYEMLNGAEVQGVSVESGVNAQPIGLDMILQGAMNRAKSAFAMSECDLAFGLESGIFPAPHTKSDYFDTCACAIYDGTTFHLGMSSCFEWPAKMIKAALEEGKELSAVALEIGLSEDEKTSEGSGSLNVLTRGKMNRIDFTYQSIVTAMVHLENAGHY